MLGTCNVHWASSFYLILPGRKALTWGDLGSHSLHASRGSWKSTGGRAGKRVDVKWGAEGRLESARGTGARVGQPAVPEMGASLRRSWGPRSWSQQPTWLRHWRSATRTREGGPSRCGLHASQPAVSAKRRGLRQRPKLLPRPSEPVFLFWPQVTRSVSHGPS